MIYLFVFILSVIFANLAEKCLNIKQVGIATCYSLLSILLLTSLAGYRDITVGIDTSYYPVTAWELTQTNKLDNDWLYLSSFLEPLYILLAYVSHSIYNDISFFLWFTHFIIISCFYIAFIRMRHISPMWFMMLLFCFLYYNTSINLSRQSLAVAVCILGYSFLERRRMLPFILCVGVGFLFHKSSCLALILIPIMYLPQKYNKYIIMGLVFAFITYSTLVSHISVFNGFEKFEQYQVNGEMRGTFSITEFILRVIFLIIIYFSLRNNMTAMKANILTCFICELIMNLFQIKSAYMGRIGYYMFVLYFIYIPWAINRYNNDKKLLLKCTVIGLSICSWWYVYIFNKAGQTFPYTSEILGIN